MALKSSFLSLAFPWPNLLIVLHINNYNILLRYCYMFINYSFAWKLETISPAIKLYFH